MNTNQMPEWLFITTRPKGSDVKHINEPLFCRYFNDKCKLVRINRVFYRDGKEISEDEIRKLIQKEIEPYIIERTGRKTEDLLKTISNNAVTVQPEPDELKIYCADNVTLSLQYDGTVIPTVEESFTLLRLPVIYDPDADCPTFKKYLNELFHSDDIPVIQEYIGYCLIPSTKAQAGLFINGKGGEGKSVLRDVLMRMFGATAIQEDIHRLSDRFVMATLQYRLLCIDDDLKTEKLNETGTIKKLITASGPMSIERKGIDKFDAYIYTRLIGLGNSFIGSKFDQSDGFYRRQLLVTVKPKTRNAEQDDAFLSHKLASETSGILNWALEGLERLTVNKFHFTKSDRMNDLISSVRSENDNTIEFFTDCVETSDSISDIISSADMWVAYVLWCEDNGFSPIKHTSFNTKVSNKYKEKKNKVIDTDGKRVNGYIELKLTPYMTERIKTLETRKRESILTR